MSSRIDFDVRGMDEVKHMLAQVQGRELNNRMRRSLRAAVAALRGPLRAAASTNRYPRKFRRTRTRAHRNPLGVSVSPGSPLSTIFEHGARPHAIPIKRGPMAGRTVQHPGMAARPLSGPVFDANQRKAEEAFIQTLLGGL